MKTQILFLMALLCAVVASVHRTQADECCKGTPTPTPSPSSTITVTNTNDSGPGSLREAIAVANNGETINAARVSGRILLTSGALQITHNVHINGPGAGNLTVEGNFSSPVFENAASDVTISGFTITNGNGGGIFNQGGLTLRNSSVVSNAGGGIRNNPSPRNNGGLATLTITNCTVSGNLGGGISNTAAGGGGPGSSSAALTVNNCTISGNSAANGGGIYNAASGGVQFGSGATVGISNSTISGNSATGDGGAIYNSGGAFTLFGGLAGVAVKNSTISGNSATGHGGGIFNQVGGSRPRSNLATVELGDTILKAGSSGGNIFNNGGTVTSLGYNLATDNGGGFLTGPGDQINTFARLGPLQDNGGPTFTRALLSGSPAINAGNPNFTGASFDQRGPGFHRVVNGRIDIGSFEVQ